MALSPSLLLTFSSHGHDHSLKTFCLYLIVFARSVVSTSGLCFANVIIDVLLLLTVACVINHASATASFVFVATGTA